MRILVLADKIPTRRRGDGLRILGLLQPLVGVHRFDLLCFGSEGETLDAEFRFVFDHITVLPAPASRRAGLARRIADNLSLGEFKKSSSQMRADLRAAIESGRYDLVLESAANALTNLPNEQLPIPLIVDSIDEPLLRDLRALRHAPWSRRPYLLHRVWMFWRYERAFLGRADMNIYASEIDAQVYSRLFPGRPVAVVPSGVDTRYFSPVERPNGPPTVVFEGNMNFGPNVDAAQRLVRDVLPYLEKLVPNVRVQLVGRDPLPEVKALASARVEITGTVDDVRPYLAGADVFACAMKLGSGIKNKILQAWAMGRAVVATSSSLGGINAKDEFNLLVRDKPEEFASAVASLIQDPKRAARLGAAARMTVEAEFSWEHCSKKLDQLLRSVPHRSTGRGHRSMALDDGSATQSVEAKDTRM